MVKQIAQWSRLLWLAAFACAASRVVAAEAAIPILREGMPAPREFTAPAEFVAIDTERTVELFRASGQQPPLVVRRNAQAGAQAMAQFEEAFARTRETFLAAVEREFGARQLDGGELASAKFRTFRVEFQGANSLLPVNLMLAQTWARGDDGNTTRDRLAGVLRDMINQRLIGELRPASTTFVVDLPVTEQVRAWGQLAQFARPVREDEIVTLARASEELRRWLDPLDRLAAGFLAGLLQPNVEEDAFLTGLLLHERFGDAVVHRRYAAGEVIATAGQPLDRWAILALTHVGRAGLHTLPEILALATNAGSRDAGAPVARAPAIRSDVVYWSVIGGLVVLALALTVLPVIVVRRRRRRDERHDEWSEQTVVEPPPGLREALIPHLARELKDRLVQVLFAQRHALLENERAASARVAEMEARLAKLQPAIAEKIRAYEQRIEALEQELDEKDQETRDLIRAKLVLAREELAAEISRNRLDWN